MSKILRAPVDGKTINELRAGDQVLVEGTVYAARDAAHKRMVEALNRQEQLPVDLNGQIIYYVGPCPAPPGQVIGSAGPTTSGRMDAYTPQLLSQGLRVMIGKGDRNPEVIAALQTHKAVYLAAIGGAGVYLAQRISAAEIVAYPELGPEALLRLEVQDFPCVVAIDCRGNSVFNRFQ